jgi:4-diphosphocytidyl-2-C-methyl-D-erythritol kinase
VVIKPSFGVATAEAYGWLDADRASGGTERPGGPAVEVGWPSGPLPLWNDLMGPVGRRHPAIAEMVQACLACGATGAQMTGSGSAVFGLFPESITSKAARHLKRPDWLVQVARTQTRREAARHMGL